MNELFFVIWDVVVYAMSTAEFQEIPSVFDCILFTIWRRMYGLSVPLHLGEMQHSD